MPARFSRGSQRERCRSWRGVFSANRALAQGLVIAKRQAAALAKNAASAEALARGLAPKRLAGEIVAAPTAKQRVLERSALTLEDR